MANFSSLKQAIETYIYENGHNDITGGHLQSILLSMVTEIGDGAVNDLESDVSDINSDISDINGALTASVQFTGGSLVFKNANDTVLYSIAVSTFLDGIVARLNSGAVYAGYAAPSTTPDTLAGQKVFYVATQAGTYIHFLYNDDTPITLAKDGIYFIVSGAGADDWNAEPIQQFDDVPTPNSNNPIKSGAVLRSIIQDGSAFDLSAHNAVGGVLATYADLSEALTALNSLDAVYKQPGMSFRFVQSFDNKYVQYRLMADEFTTDIYAWQGVDSEPKAGSKNYVESGGTDYRFLMLENKTSKLRNLTPVTVYDHAFMTAAGAINEGSQFYNYEVWKYEVSPFMTYFYSARIGTDVNGYMLFVKDASDDSYIDRLNRNYNIDMTVRDESFTTSADAKYVYINVTKKFKPCFCLATYSETSDIDIENKLALKSFNLNIKKSFLHYAYIAGEAKRLMPFKDFCAVEFEVKENNTYIFSNKFSAGNTAKMIYFFDYKEDFIGSASYSGSSEEDVVYTNALVMTPSGCRYVIMNVELVHSDFAKFELYDVKKDLLVKPILTTLSNPEVTANSYWNAKNNRSYENDSFQIWKYAVTPNTVYMTTGAGLLSSANAYHATFIDTDGNTIYGYGRRPSDEPVEYIFVTPPNAAYVYINVTNDYVDSYSMTAMGDTTDRSSEIAETLAKNGHCKLGSGVFFVNGIEMPENCTLEGCGNSSIVVLSGSSDGYAVKLSRFDTISNIRFLGSLEDIQVDEPSDINTIDIGNRHGILLLGESSETHDTKFDGNDVTNCTFRNFSGGAITCDATGYSVYDGLLINGCRMSNCGCGINIAWKSEFNRATACIIHDCTYGVINNGGNNTFVNCDLSKNGVGIYFNGSTDKCIRYDGTTATGVNMAHGLMDGCTIQHSGLGNNMNSGYMIVVLNTTGGFLFTGMQVGYGKIRIIKSSYMQFCNCRFGRSIFLDAISPYLIVLSNLTFGSVAPVIRIWTDETMTILDTNYLDDGNLRSARMLNSFSTQLDEVSIRTFAPTE